jgi:hypothetical protein
VTVQSLAPSVVVHRPPRQRRRAVHVSFGVRALRWTAWLLAALSAAWLLFFASGDQRWVFTPVLLMVNVGFLYLTHLYARDGVLPLFEIGTVYLAALVVYSVVPLLNFAAGGMTWTEWSDPRLREWMPNAREVGTFAFRHVLFLVTFTGAYLLLRRNHLPRTDRPPRPDTATAVAIAVWFLILTAYFPLLDLFVGRIPTVYEGGTGFELRQRAPYIVAQLTHIVMVMQLTLKQAIAVTLLVRWRQLRWRIAFFAWIVFELLSTTTALQGRSGTVVLLLSAGLLYHALVRPLRLRTAAVAGVALLAGFLLFGMLRDLRRLETMASNFDAAKVFNNEFQVLWANAYDLHMRRQTGMLTAIPWQIYVSDLYMIIPSQLLPFQKIDPSDWYLEELGLTGTGQGVMFGAIAQGVVGLDWVEIGVRGALLGLIFAGFHRWYTRRRDSFWATTFYVCICTWSYYTFRSTTFFFIYMILYQFVSVWVVLQFTRFVLSRGARVAWSWRGAPPR